METYTIRLAQPEDFDTIWSLIRRTVTKMNAEGSEQWGEHYPTPADFQNDIQKQRLLAAISPQGKLVGVACFTDEEEADYLDIPFDISAPAAVVHRLAVDPDVRRQGIAHLLLDRVEAWAKEQGIPTFHVDTYSKNTVMQGFFERRGFVQKGTFSLPHYTLPFLVYEKLLK